MQHCAKPLTGNQYTISSGDYLAIVCEQGATLRTLRWKGRDLLASFDANEPVPCSNGNLLVPFPNRIQGGTYTFEGRTYTLPIDEHERNNAIHGMGYRSFWNLAALTDDAVELSWRIAPTLKGYPFALEVHALYRLDEAGLHLTVTARNNGSRNLPWAFGMHPWISNGKDLRGNDAILAQNDLCSLQIGASTHVEVDGNLIPTGTEPVNGTKYDFREVRSLKGQVLDDAFCDPVREPDGLTLAHFVRPDGITVTLDGDRTINAWQVCTGTGFPAESHPSGVAIEPMTAYANAFRTGRDLVTLRPGEEYATTVAFSARKD